jgi:23S rRNA (adenine2503-C2)-methyltransferase
MFFHSYFVLPISYFAYTLFQYENTPAMKYIDKRQSLDGSTKYLWQLDDLKTVESIYFTFREEKYTCISSQVGCNVKCVFCETGKQNNLRDLTPVEIFNQVKQTMHDLDIREALYQVAFAGMGEPLLNIHNVIAGAEMIIENKSASSISLSTSGIVPRIYELVDTPVTRLFISLHASTNEARNYLVPINSKYPIEQLIKASDFFFEKVGTKITATYLLFEDLNDTNADLARLANLLNPDVYTIQLSVWNTIGDVKLKPSKRIYYFEESLRDMGYDVFVLNSKGSDVEGGCGQLRSRNNELIR